MLFCNNSWKLSEMKMNLYNTLHNIYVFQYITRLHTHLYIYIYIWIYIFIIRIYNYTYAYIAYMYFLKLYILNTLLNINWMVINK